MPNCVEIIVAHPVGEVVICEV